MGEETKEDQIPETSQEENSNKTFTQEELENIIQERLTKEKEKYNAENTAKEQELKDREMRLLTREKLLDNGLPKELAEVIRANDEKDLEKAISLLNVHINGQKEKKPGFHKVGGNPQNNEENEKDYFRNVMKNPALKS